MKYPWELPADPCKRGHFAKRYADGSCATCRLEDGRKWRAGNPEAMPAYQKRHYRSRRVRMLIRMAGVRAGRKKLPFDLDQHVEYYEAVLKAGKCQLTGLPFDLKTAGTRLRKNPNSPSLDRIKPELGYIKDNVRLVLWAVNVGLGNWGLEKYREIAIALNQEVVNTVKALQADMLFAFKHTAVMIRSSNPALCMVVNTERGPDMPAGKACFTDGTVIEMVDIGMPQPGVPFMTPAELAKLLFRKASELGLELA